MTKIKRDVEPVTDYTKDNRHFYPFNGKTMAKVFALTQTRSIFQSDSQISIEEEEKKPRIVRRNEDTRVAKKSRRRLGRRKISDRRADVG